MEENSQGTKKQFEKKCPICSRLFLSLKNNTKYCPKCRDPKIRKAYLQKVKMLESKSGEGLKADAAEAEKRNMTYGQLQAERYLQLQHKEMQKRRKEFIGQQDTKEI